MQPQPSLDYPRVYRASLSNRAVMYVLGAIAGGAGALGVWYFGGGHDAKTQGGAAMAMAIISFAFLLVGAYLIYSVAHFQVVLSADSIDVQTVARSRRYLRSELSAWQVRQPTKGPNMLVLSFRDASRRPLKIPQYFNFDLAFREWLSNLGDLDRVERAAFEREVNENTALGLTEDDRRSKLASARRASKVLIVATILACVWVLFLPFEYRLAVTVLALIPWAGLWVAGSSHGIFRIDQKRNDPHPSVAIPFMMPGFILMLRAITDVHLLGWQTALAMTIVITAVMSFAAYKADPSLRVNCPMLALLFLLGLAYGFGVTTLSNALLDRGKATVYSTQVEDKYISHGSSTTYRLYLTAWGPKTEPDWVDVSRRFYDSAPKGSTVCVYLREGAWRIPWYVVGHCAR